MDMKQIDEVDRQYEVLHSPFDINTHLKTFIGYLEIIIRSDGTIEYAVPSHMKKLAEIYGKPLDDIFEEYFESKAGLDPTEWLCAKTECIAVWYDGYTGKPNPKQRRALLALKENKAYGGKI